MASLTRRIQRTLIRKMVEHRRGRHFMGRGSKLGVKNPRDPCVTGKRKPPKTWRAKADAPAIKPMLRPKESLRPTLTEIRAAHRAKMQKKEERRGKIKSIDSTVAYLAKTNRHTGRPHEHKRSNSRRLRQMASRAATTD